MFRGNCCCKVGKKAVEWARAPLGCAECLGGSPVLAQLWGHSPSPARQRPDPVSQTWAQPLLLSCHTREEISFLGENILVSSQWSTSAQPCQAGAQAEAPCSVLPGASVQGAARQLQMIPIASCPALGTADSSLTGRGCWFALQPQEVWAGLWCTAACCIQLWSSWCSGKPAAWLRSPCSLRDSKEMHLLVKLLMEITLCF